MWQCVLLLCSLSMVAASGPILPLLNDIKGPPMRLYHIQLESVKLWMATPDWESPQRVPGAEWYLQAWRHGRFAYYGVCGQMCLSKLTELFSCNPSTLMIQVGAHQGVFPLMSAAMGCRALAVEGHPVHIPYIRLNAALNDFADRFDVVNAIGGNKDMAKGLAFGDMEVIESGAKPANAITVPMVKIDTLVGKYPSDTAVNVIFIDVEGFENEVLLGAKELIASKRVRVWNIELWYMKAGAVRTMFPGMELLEDNGYRFFINPTDAKSGMNLKGLIDYRGVHCANAPKEQCLADVLAVREDDVGKVTTALQGMFGDA